MAKIFLPRRLQLHLRDKAWVREQIASGKSVQEILELSDSLVHELHEVARDLFEQHHYHDAADAFLFLVTLNPSRCDLWLGLGASTQWAGDYEGAIDAYEMAAICEIENPLPYFYLANCLFAIHERDSALQAIELALEYSEDKEEHNNLHSQALAAKAVLLKEGI